MRRHSRPLTSTRPRRYRVIHTSAAEEAQWLSEDQQKALTHLRHLQEQGPLTPAQQAQLDRLTQKLDW